MSAQDLLDELAALPEFTRVPPPVDDFSGLVQSGDLQIAELARSAEGRSQEGALRRVYKDSTKSQATTLVLVASDRDSEADSPRLKVIGPQGGDSTQVTVAPEALLKVLREAVKEEHALLVRQAIARGIDKISLEGIGGVRVRGLGTEHLYKRRLRRGKRWQQLQELADAAGRAPSTDWQDLLVALGYKLTSRHPRQGWIVAAGAQTVAVVHGFTDPTGFSRLDEQGSLPEGKLLDDCAVERAPFGILAAGSQIRLIVAEPTAGGSIGRYLELDPEVIDSEDAPLLGLLAPEYLANGQFMSLLDEAREYGADLKERVDREIRQSVLPELGRAVGQWAATKGRDLTDESVREDLQAASLTLLFRLLFLFYAESSGFLPVSNVQYAENSLTRTAYRAREDLADLDAKSFVLWERTELVVSAMRTGNAAWEVPGYNGELFSPTGFDGAETLEQIRIDDVTFGRVLNALTRDDEDPETGVDYSSLEIGHLGHIYEGLLALKLSLADRALSYDEKKDRYVAADGESVEVHQGELVWTTDEGGRKAGGVYYTREEIVRHLVRNGVVPRFQKHLDDVAEKLKDSPAAAAEKLFDFHVVDPSCGSAHFLVAVVDELADEVAKFVGRTPIKPLRDMLDGLLESAKKPAGYEIDDAQVLRRLIVKHCVYGVDISPMGAEIAKLSLWLTSFVPGLSLMYLGRNVIVGNSLIGVSRAESVLAGGDSGAMTLGYEEPIEAAMRDAAAAAAALAEKQDRTPEEYKQSERIAEDFRARVANARRYFDLWCAEPLGVRGSRKLFFGDGVMRQILESGAVDLAMAPAKLRAEVDDDVLEEAAETAKEFRFLHWPLEFPHVFADGRGGFDAVVGNPPWEEVATGELFFYARYRPGIAALPQADREAAIATLKIERPELAIEYAREQELMARMRGYLGKAGGFKAAAGDPDLYKLFCQRYDDVLRDGGALAVVLPRTAFQTKGSRAFREWLLDRSRIERIDFLLNNRRWMFDIHPQYSVALLVAAREAPKDPIRTAGVATSLTEFLLQSESDGVETPLSSLGPGGEVPLVKSDAEGKLLAKLRANGSPVSFGGSRWTCFPVAELHETNDKRLWANVKDGWSLWKGASFDQYEPSGNDARICEVEGGLKKAHKPRPGMDSIVASRFDNQERAEAVSETVGRARVAFRDVTNRTNSRTSIACLIPPEVFLTNKAPYLAFVEGGRIAESACLGIINSASFDWQARRYVEINMNFFVFELLRVPALSTDQFNAIAIAAAQLSCVDDRYSEFAEEVGVEPGPVSAARRRELRIEIDAQVARAWDLSEEELRLVFADFTESAVPLDYREGAIARLAELA